MQSQLNMLDSLADLIDYPGRAAPVDAELLVREVERRSPDAGRALERFIGWRCSISDTACEEFYTRTFDSRPETALEIGWHLFGESYQRGAFLVSMREQLREHGIDECGELPDHLTLVLRVCARLDDERAARVGELAIAPALSKIAVALAAGDNPYEHLLEAILQLLKTQPSLHSAGATSG